MVPVTTTLPDVGLVRLPHDTTTKGDVIGIKPYALQCTDNDSKKCVKIPLHPVP